MILDLLALTDFVLVHPQPFRVVPVIQHHDGDAPAAFAEDVFRANRARRSLRLALAGNPRGVFVP